MKWFVIVCGLLVLGLVLRLELLVYAMYVLGGVLLISRFMTREWTTRLAAHRTADAGAVQIGERVTIEVELENKSALPVPWVIIEEALPRGAMKPPFRLKAKGKTLFVAKLAARGTKRIRYEVEFLARGYHQFGPLMIESGDLFGLQRRFRVLSEPVYVLVYPEVVPLRSYDITSRRPLGEIRMTHRLFEDPTRIAGVRPYQAGDPLSRIHWPAFARTGVLHSKVFEPSCVAGATLVLDFHQRSLRFMETLRTEDLMITTAASLANAVYELGQQVGFVTNGRDAAERLRTEGWRAEWRTRRDAARRLEERPPNERLEPVVLPAARGPEQIERIYETLARLERTDGFEFAEMIDEVAARIPRDASVIAILFDVTEDIARRLGELRRSGFSVSVVVVIESESGMRDWAVAPEWAQLLVRERIDFRPVFNNESLAELQADALLNPV